MFTAYTADQIRTAERALMATLPEGTLMRRAATGLAAVCAALLPRVYGSRVVLLVGSGDNGGDALYAGATLTGRGAAVTAVLAGSRAHEAGLAALLAAGGRATGHSAAAFSPGGAAAPRHGDALVTHETAVWGGGGDADEARRAVERADLIVDGLVGIGASGALREPYAGLAEAAGRAAAPVVAVDVPSGVDSSTGRVEGAAIRAAVTVTMGARKTGLLVDPGATLAGRIELVDIGLGPYLPDPDVTALTRASARGLLPRPAAESDKYRRGVVGVAAGSDHYTGAAVLAVGGALNAGAGMVRYAGPARPAGQVRARWPEAVVTELDAPDVDAVGRVQAWVVGPGLGTGEWARELLRRVLATDVPVLVDADGLNLVARDVSLLRRTAPVLITPHAGELARLTGTARGAIEAAPLAHARAAAAELGVTVLLKGSTTVVAEEGTPTWVNGTGTPWLATGGTGDVLSGVAGSLLAQGLGAREAGACGAYLHGLAGRIAAAGAPLTAAGVAEALPAAIRELNEIPAASQR
ncbi:NAD(P)H-hydrate dehydratase [Nonomuraea sp. MCN248]|uniref:Bifunctional NAD(P)H-hydrate repair enzyme n=1 Tax=Nonomuraea corallina TaxID=2989783 RepID=A0ABT4S6C1_9ACTN|nr:NAD(P)H-hydrate dehydratase [Nonomuraea corallina]MDA0632486.1 NAD(P)H-hydrate dehydratase [Nonomuraea corallina]